MQHLQSSIDQSFIKPLPLYEDLLVHSPQIHAVVNETSVELEVSSALIPELGHTTYESSDYGLVFKTDCSVLEERKHELGYQQAQASPEYHIQMLLNKINLHFQPTLCHKVRIKYDHIQRDPKSKSMTTW